MMETSNIFSEKGKNLFIDRINKLKKDQKPLWGKMSVDQMLAHVNIGFETAYEEEKFKKPNFIMKLILNNIVKPTVVGDTPYKKNSRTAPEFIVEGERDFEAEKKRLFDYIEKTFELGESHFDNKVSRSFGPLSKQQWNTLFSKHLNHHLSQFGV